MTDTSQSITRAVILAAGFGTRFLPATKAQPKEMLPIVDKPVIQYIVEDAVASGITDIIIITGWHKRGVEDHFDRHFELEAKLAAAGKEHELQMIREISEKANFIYVRQNEQLGDGHAVLRASHLLKGTPFVVTAADDLLDESVPSIKQLIDLYNEQKAATVAVHKVPRERISKYGVIAGEKIHDHVYKVEKMVEKPRPEEAPSDLAVILRYVVTTEMLDELQQLTPQPGEELRLIDGAIRLLAKGGSVYAKEFTGEWYDIGSKHGFLRATVAYGLKHKELNDEFRAYLKSLTVDIE